jgi:hypothetical protein
VGKIKRQILILGLMTSFCVNAQTISPLIEQYYHSQELMPLTVNTNDIYWSLGHISPFRKVDSGKIIDFTIPINAQDSGKLIPQWADDYFIIGNAISITTDGILVQVDHSSQYLGNVVFLKNYPYKERIIDGDTIFDIAYPSTNYTYKYVTVQGNEATVRCYDHGEDIVPQDVPFDVIRITPIGAMEVTITNLSIAKFNQSAKKSISATNGSIDASNLLLNLAKTNQPYQMQK